MLSPIRGTENQFPVLDGFEQLRIVTTGADIDPPKAGQEPALLRFTKAVVQVTLRGNRAGGP